MRGMQKKGKAVRKMSTPKRTKPPYQALNVT